ncbi:uracil-DNA glycosylase family protein [Rickettsia endosymbiont of Halotydeus destructor]|uniref:uracil-DNA glycosylase family protein n=1 Tax=Rickettsia endosymbiont of Halotydeus destructor TaxID=2996754 RepID=UPI003BAEB34E
MDYLLQKNNQLKWLRAIGIEYYCSESIKEIEINKVINQTELENSKVEVMKKSTVIVNPLFEENSNISLARSLADKANNIAELKESLLNFNGCDLKKLANNTVFGDGNPKAPIMLIGEAPGNNEDLKGIPFCGESGNLLDNMLLAIGVSRKDNAYITNTVFWRPPANRQPTLEEVDICRPFVEKHIALINPKLIILVGSTAATSLLGKNAGITKIRQEYYSYTNKYLTAPIQTTAIFHPAYLLRQPMQKRTSWYDLLKIKEYLANKNLV